MKKNVVILGTGSPDGIGGALARRFALEGLNVIVTGRSLEKINEVESEVTNLGGSIQALQVDVTSQKDQDGLFSHVKEAGELTAVLFNAGNNAIIPFEDLSAKQFEYFWRICCYGGFLTAQRAMPILREQGYGSMIFTGASGSLRGKAGFSHFASGKAALRNLAQSLAREYGPHGVHVAHVIIDGIVNGNTAKRKFPEYLDNLGEDGALSPNAIAEAYWYLHSQSRTAWSHELDLRPYRENW